MPGDSVTTNNIRDQSTDHHKWIKDIDNILKETLGWKKKRKDKHSDHVAPRKLKLLEERDDNMN